MMPTILEALENTLVVLENNGFPPGGSVYDDFAQAVKQLKLGDNVEVELEDDGR